MGELSKQSRLLEIEEEADFTKQTYRQVRARKHIIDFIKYTKPDYQVMPFHKYLCDKLDDFVNGKIKRLIVKAPPRHGKSEVVSRRLPAYIFGRFPDAQIIASSYSGDLSSRMNRDVQRVMETQSYREVFPRTRIKDYDNKEDFRAIRNNDLFEVIGHKGVYRSAGIGGGITGMGANFAIIDDPIKDAEQADSQTYRDALWEWYGTTLYSRLEKNAGVLICATSWHQDDLSHRLIDLAKSNPQADQWEIVSFPAISEDDKPLWPDKYPLSELLKMKSTVGSRVFSALWQQEPSPAEGSMIKRSWIKFYKQRPDYFHEIIQSWDLTVKDKPQNDRTVGHVWGRKGADKYLLDRVSGHMDINDEMIAIRCMHGKWPKATAIIVEDKANGPAVITLLKNEIPGIIPFDPKTSKANRLAAISPEFEAGNVYFPDPSIAPWVSDTIEELVSFPTAKHDDEVDATTMALLRLRQSNVGDIPNLGRYALGRTYAPSLTGSDSW